MDTSWRTRMRMNRRMWARRSPTSLVNKLRAHAALARLAQIAQCQLELIQAVMKLVFGDHQWRRNTDGGPVRVLGEYIPARQRLADVPTRAKAGIDVHSCPQSA